MLSYLIKTQVNGSVENRVKILLKFIVKNGIISEELVDPSLYEGSPAQFIISQVDHTTSGYCSWGGHCKILDFEKDSHLSSELDSLTIGQAKSHVIIKHCVHVLDPKSIDWTIKYDPSPVFPAFLGSCSHYL